MCREALLLADNDVDEAALDVQARLVHQLIERIPADVDDAHALLVSLDYDVELAVRQWYWAHPPPAPSTLQRLQRGIELAAPAFVAENHLARFVLLTPQCESILCRLVTHHRRWVRCDWDTDGALEEPTTSVGELSVLGATQALATAEVWGAAIGKFRPSRKSTSAVVLEMRSQV